MTGARGSSWTTGYRRRHEVAYCKSCQLPRTSRPAPTCAEPRHAEFHQQRLAGNNARRKQARLDARARGEVKRWGSAEKQAERQRRGYRKRRADLIERLGGKCERCGFNDPRALHAHHREGGGSRERKELGFRYVYVLARMALEELRAKFNLLCANCHAIEHAEELQA